MLDKDKKLDKEKKPVNETGEVIEDTEKKSQSTQRDLEPSIIAGKTLDKNATAKKVVVKGNKKKKAAPFLRGGRGQAHIKSTYNNTIITVTDLNGAVLIWSSAGKCGFKGSRKSTPYAAGMIVKSIADKVKELGIKDLDIFVKGLGTGREAAIRAFDTNGLKVISIKDVTPIPHGGCRPKKRRRV